MKHLKLFNENFNNNNNQINESKNSESDSIALLLTSDDDSNHLIGLSMIKYQDIKISEVVKSVLKNLVADVPTLKNFKDGFNITSKLPKIFPNHQRYKKIVVDRKSFLDSYTFSLLYDFTIVKYKATSKGVVHNRNDAVVYGTGGKLLYTRSVYDRKYTYDSIVKDSIKMTENYNKFVTSKKMVELITKTISDKITELKI